MKTYRKIQSFVQAEQLTDDNAESLAKVCGGKVTEDRHAVTNEPSVMVLVPTLQGPERLRKGAFLVRRDHRFTVETPEAFLAEYEPIGRG